MSNQPDGKNVCDRCGADVGNASVFNCIVVSDYTENGLVINYHFCREATEELPDAQNCARRVLSKANVAHRREKDQPLGVATPA